MPRAATDTEADRLLRAKGRSFHWARHLMGRRHGTRATRLYGFCRLVDDLADEATSPAEGLAALDGVRADLGRGDSGDPLVRDFLALTRECGIEEAIPLALIDGAASDLGSVRMTDDESLLMYCYQVAGTVGLMMAAALDLDAPEARPRAIDLGIAMQLTNICRDVSEDAVMGRRYLPASLIGDRDPAELIRPSAILQPTVRKGVSSLLDLADRYYRSGEEGIAALPRRARPGVLVAARVYRAIGSQLRARDCDYWTSRVLVGRGAKLALTLGAILQSQTLSARHAAHPGCYTSLRGGAGDPPGTFGTGPSSRGD